MSQNRHMQNVSKMACIVKILSKTTSYVMKIDLKHLVLKFDNEKSSLCIISITNENIIYIEVHCVLYFAKKIHNISLSKRNT